MELTYFPLKDASEMANSVDPDQTAPFMSSLICVCTVWVDMSYDCYGAIRNIVLLCIPDFSITYKQRDTIETIDNH